MADEKLRSRIARLMRTQPDRHTQPSFGAMSFSGREDTAGRPVIEFTPQVMEVLRLGNSYQSYAEIYRTQWAVRVCVKFLAANIAHLNLRCFRRGDETPEVLNDHPAAKLIQRPNPRTTRFDLIRDTVSDLAIYDNAFWLKMFVNDARMLIRVPPAYVTPKEGNILLGAAAYLVDTGSGPQEFSPEQVVHFKGYNAIDPRMGQSPLEALRGVLLEEWESSRHRAGFWQHSARRDGLIERPLEAPEWSDTARERFREDFQKKHSGSNNAGKAVVLEDGMKWNPDSFSPKDSEFIAGREFTLDTVATVYQIPLALLSRKNTATFASLKEFRKVLYSDVLGPWNAMLEGTINAQLLSDFRGVDYVEFNIDEKLQGDFEEQANAARNSVQVPWLSVNEQRKLRGFKHIDDPDFEVPAKPGNYNVPEPVEAAPATATQPTVQSVPNAASNGEVELVALEHMLEGMP